MPEMQLNPVQGCLFKGAIAVSREIAVAEISQSAVFCRLGSIAGGRFAVKLQEAADVHSRWDFEQTLLDPHQEVVGLSCLGHGFGLRDSADGEGVALAMVEK